MWIHSVLISLFAIVGSKVYAESDICGTKTLSASSTPRNLEVKENILNTEITCQYTIKGVVGEFVKIEFQKPADASGKSTCDKQFVKLEGVNDAGIKTQIATVCASASPKTYYSSGSQMIVTIQGKKDDQAPAQAKAFNITYQSDSSVKELCGETALTAGTSDSEDWTAPKSPLEVNRICVYTITAKPLEVVQLTFKQIAGSSSQQDAATQTLIRLENFKDGVQTSIADIPPGEKNKLVYNSTDETMIVTLFGASGLTGDLFTAVYKSVIDPYCGPVDLEAKEQPSPEWKFPLQTLKSARNCTYKIQAEDDKTVQLNITALNFDVKTGKSQCSAPYLKVESGDTLIKDICDTKTPYTISSTTSTMIVKLFGVANLQQNAVAATYKAVQGAANNVLLSFSSLLITALLCFLQS